MAEGEISLRAMSLVYTTLLSLAPLLAPGFLRGSRPWGCTTAWSRCWSSCCGPLGDQAAVISQHLIGFVDKHGRSACLGFLGRGHADLQPPCR